MRRSRSRSRGSALLISLGALALMSAFAVGLMSLVRLEERASQNSLDERRATLAAEAGIHRALVELSATFEEPLTARIAPWAYLDKQGDFGHGVAFADAGRISLFSATASPPMTLPLDGEPPLAYSGCLGHTYSDGGDVYSLKILDATTQLDLNDREPGLAKILDTLGVAIAEQRGRDPVRGRGEEIVALRDRNGRLDSKRQLAPLLGVDDYKLLADFVTVDGWPDPAARRALAPKERDAAIEDMTLPRFVPERRCPINVNAAPKAVLVALLAGVGTTSSDPVTYDQARKIADLMVARRKSLDPTEGPFRGMTDLEDWLTGLASTGSQAILAPEQAGALIANLDPNLRVVEVNPDTSARLPVSKYDLDHRTTEATFFSHGKFEVTSLGRVVAHGRIVAEVYRMAVIRAYEVARHTTQLDFEANALADTTDNVAALPNQTRRLGGWAASNDEGYVQLSDPEAQIGLDLTGERMFQAPYTGTLDGSDQGLAGGTFLGSMVPGFFDPRTGIASGTSKFLAATAPNGGNFPALGQRLEDKLALAGGDLYCDGTHTAPRHRQCFYKAAPPVDEGTIDLWLKVDQDTTSAPGSVIQAVNVLSNDVVLVTDLTAATDGSTLTLELRRKAFFASSDSIVPYATGETRVRAVMPRLGTYGEWHHVRIAWVSGTEASLYVDGELAPAAAKLPLDSASPSWPPACAIPAEDSLVVGGHDAADGPLWRQMTVDDVVVEGPPAALPVSFPGPERYPAQDVDFVGRFLGAFGPFGEDVEFGTIYWTERDPTSWGKVQFSPGDFTTTGVVNGILSIGKDHDGKKKDDKKDDHKGDGDKGDGDKGKGGGGKGKGGKGGGGSVGKVTGSGPTSGAALGPTDFLRPELAMMRPPVSASDRSIIYEIRFKYQKDNLLLRGIVVPPLNVSPILDDVTLVYRTRAMIVRTETDED